MPVPPGHQEIGVKELGNLSIKDGALYWNGEKLKTEAEVRLSRRQAIVAALLSFLVGAASIAAPVFAYFADRDNICRNSNHARWLLCPREPESATSDTIDTGSNEASRAVEEDQLEPLP